MWARGSMAAGSAACASRGASMMELSRRAARTRLPVPQNTLERLLTLHRSRRPAILPTVLPNKALKPMALLADDGTCSMVFSRAGHKGRRRREPCRRPLIHAWRENLRRAVGGSCSDVEHSRHAAKNAAAAVTLAEVRLVRLARDRGSARDVYRGRAARAACASSVSAAGGMMASSRPDDWPSLMANARLG